MSKKEIVKKEDVITPIITIPKKATTTTVRVVLKQEKGEIEFTKTVDSRKVDEISGTVSKAIVDFAERVKKYKLKLDNFSFSRKFQVIIEIDNETASMNDLGVKSTVIFGVTMKKPSKFMEFMNDIVAGILYQDSKLVLGYKEVYTEQLQIEEEKAIEKALAEPTK